MAKGAKEDEKVEREGEKGEKGKEERRAMWYPFVRHIRDQPTPSAQVFVV